MEQLLQDIDELLAHLEDYEHGETGRRITELRGRISNCINLMLGAGRDRSTFFQGWEIEPVFNYTDGTTDFQVYPPDSDKGYVEPKTTKQKIKMKILRGEY